MLENKQEAYNLYEKDAQKYFYFLGFAAHKILRYQSKQKQKTCKKNNKM